MKETEKEMDDIVETARRAGTFRTLVVAIETAGLEETLSGGYFTVFAPDDDAFERLSRLDLRRLKNDPERLRSALLHHLVAGRLATPQIPEEGTLTTVSGESLGVRRFADAVHVETARVVRPDIEAENGVIHAIDAVLLPA